jgi:hypothetical protein
MMTTCTTAWPCAAYATGPSTRVCWAFQPKYLMLLSGELRIAQNMAGYLLTLENRSIIGPEESELWPRKESLQWHRQNVFREG